MPDIKYGIHFGDAKADKDSETELLSTLKDLVYAKTTPPLRGRFGVRGIGTPELLVLLVTKEHLPLCSTRVPANIIFG